jgi:hypothetical protein
MPEKYPVICRIPGMKYPMINTLLPYLLNHWDVFSNRSGPSVTVFMKKWSAQFITDQVRDRHPQRASKTSYENACYPIQFSLIDKETKVTHKGFSRNRHRNEFQHQSKKQYHISILIHPVRDPLQIFYLLNGLTCCLGRGYRPSTDSFLSGATTPLSTKHHYHYHKLYQAYRHSKKATKILKHILCHRWHHWHHWDSSSSSSHWRESSSRSSSSSS